MQPAPSLIGASLAALLALAGLCVVPRESHAQAPSRPATAATAARCGDVVLRAALWSAAPGWSRALLHDGTRETAVREGDLVRGRRVVAIRRDRVALAGPGGEVCVAAREDAPASGIAAAQRPCASARLRRRAPCLIRLGPATVALRREALEAMLEDQAELMRSARVVPEIEDGRTVGVRLFGIRAETDLRALGFENGDRLERVNGYSVGDPQSALEAYATLRVADRLIARVKRRDRRLDLVILIR